MTTAIRRLSFAGVAALAAGCGSFGRGTVSPDRSGYADAIATSWKEQMLLNLVKMKYADVPVFLDVSSVIASYTFEASGSGTIGWDTGNQRAETLGIGGAYTDKPTITYVPLTGEKFTRALMTPLPPGSVLSMVQAGWPVAGVFEISVRSVNGVRNLSRAMNPTPADPQWQELVEAWTVVQDSGAVDLRIRRTDAGETVVVVIGDIADEAVRRRRDRIREILAIPADSREFTLVFGTRPTQPTEVAMLTRSLFEILLEVSATVEVPPEDVTAGRVIPVKPGASDPMIAIRSSATKPDGAAVMTRYRDRWYYVADDDFRSKTRLMFLFFIQALQESGSKPGAGPVLTISN